MKVELSSWETALRSICVRVSPELSDWSLDLIFNIIMITFVSSVWCIYCKNNIVEYMFPTKSHTSNKKKREWVRSLSLKIFWQICKITWILLFIEEAEKYLRYLGLACWPQISVTQNVLFAEKQWGRKNSPQTGANCKDIRQTVCVLSWFPLKKYKNFHVLKTTV